MEAYLNEDPYSQYSGIRIDCTKSLASLIVVARDSRLVADGFIENATIVGDDVVEIPASIAGGNNYSSVVVNMRQIFSTTITRVSWTLRNLSQAYNAQCGESGGCMGLYVPLAGKNQRLILGASRVPFTRIPVAFQQGADPLPLLSITRPRWASRYGYSDSALFLGDILMPHNVLNMSVRSRSAPTNNCDNMFERRLDTYINDHVYIENTLQAAHTSALFFLFQDGVVRDVINHTSASTTMLAFDGNSQSINVYVYIPRLNVFLTLTGCVVLLVARVVLFFWTDATYQSTGDSLRRITTPHTIARMLVDDTTFLSTPLTRTVTYDGDQLTQVDEVFIRSISIRSKVNYEDEASSGSVLV